MELHQWAHYIHAFGPLDQGPRTFARLDAGLALIAALIINRSGGISAAPGAPAEAVNAREFMWEPGPEPKPEPDRPATLDDLKRLFGVKK